MLEKQRTHPLCREQRGRRRRWSWLLQRFSFGRRVLEAETEHLRARDEDRQTRDEQTLWKETP